MKATRRAILAFLIIFTWSTVAFAKSKRIANRDDYFGEDALRIGLKAGPVVSGLTETSTAGGTVYHQSTIRYSGGAALELLYGWSRIEIDGLWAARRNTSDNGTAYGVSFPALFKAALNLSPGIDLELGGGMQPDYITSGSLPMPMWLVGAVGAVGVVAEMGRDAFSIEARYFYGFSGINDSIDGAAPRDFSVLLGYLWAF